MDNTLLHLNDQIKTEADSILIEKGLLAVLNQFGKVHITGSYQLNLMTWRDLDIYLETENITGPDFFILGSKIASLLDPVKMSFRNETIAKTQGLPNGLYWGTYLGNEREAAWKIDTWMVNASECKKLLDYCKEIENQLTAASTLKIMEIKSVCWKDHEYRRSYSSTDIYKAVLHNGISNIQEFKEYLAHY